MPDPSANARYRTTDPTEAMGPYRPCEPGCGCHHDFVTENQSGCGDYRAAGFKPVTALGVIAQVAVCECGAFWCDHPEAWS